MSTDNSNQSQRRVPFLTKGIGSRINKLSRMVGGKKKLAEMAGLSESQLHRIISGESQAKIEPLAAMARGAGVLLDWLAFGDGPMRRDEQRSDDRQERPAMISPEIQKSIVKTMIKRCLIKSEWRLPINRFADVYNRLVADSNASDVETVVIQVLLDAYRQQLATIEVQLERNTANPSSIQAFRDYLKTQIAELEAEIDDMNQK